MLFHIRILILFLAVTSFEIHSQPGHDADYTRWAETEGKKNNWESRDETNPSPFLKIPNDKKRALWALEHNKKMVYEALVLLEKPNLTYQLFFDKKFPLFLQEIDFSSISDKSKVVPNRVRQTLIEQMKKEYLEEFQRGVTLLGAENINADILLLADRFNASTTGPHHYFLKRINGLIKKYSIPSGGKVEKAIQKLGGREGVKFGLDRLSTDELTALTDWIKRNSDSDKPEVKDTLALFKRMIEQKPFLYESDLIKEKVDNQNFVLVSTGPSTPLPDANDRDKDDKAAHDSLQLGKIPPPSGNAYNDRAAKISALEKTRDKIIEELYFLESEPTKDQILERFKNFYAIRAPSRSLTDDLKDAERGSSLIETKQRIATLLLQEYQKFYDDVAKGVSPSMIPLDCHLLADRASANKLFPTFIPEFITSLKNLGFKVDEIDGDLKKLSDPAARTRLKNWITSHSANPKAHVSLGLLLTLLDNFDREPADINLKGPNRRYLAQVARKWIDPLSEPEETGAEKRRREIAENQPRPQPQTGNHGEGPEDPNSSDILPARPHFIDTPSLEPAKAKEKRETVQLSCPNIATATRPEKIKFFDIPDGADLKKKNEILGKNRDLFYEGLMHLQDNPNASAKEMERKLRRDFIRIFNQAIQHASAKDKVFFSSDVLLLADRIHSREAQNEGNQEFFVKAALVLRHTNHAIGKELAGIFETHYRDGALPVQNGISEKAHQLLNYCITDGANCTEAAFDILSLIVTITDDKWAALQVPDRKKIPSGSTSAEPLSLLDQPENERYLAACARERFFKKSLLRPLPKDSTPEIAQDLLEKNKQLLFYWLDYLKKANSDSDLIAKLGNYYKEKTKRSLADDLKSKHVDSKSLANLIIRALYEDYLSIYQSALVVKDFKAEDLPLDTHLAADRAAGDDQYSRFSSRAAKTLKESGLDLDLNQLSTDPELRKRIAGLAIDHYHNERAVKALALLHTIVNEFSPKPNHIDPKQAQTRFEENSAVWYLKLTASIKMPLTSWANPYSYLGAETRADLKGKLVPGSPFVKIPAGANRDEISRIMAKNAELLNEAFKLLSEQLKERDIVNFDRLFGIIYFTKRSGSRGIQHELRDRANQVIQFLLADYAALWKEASSLVKDDAFVFNQFSTQSLIYARASHAISDVKPLLQRYKTLIERLPPAKREAAKAAFGLADIDALFEGLRGNGTPAELAKKANSARAKLIEKLPAVDAVDKELGSLLASLVTTDIDEFGQQKPQRPERGMEANGTLSLTRWDPVMMKQLLLEETEAVKTQTQFKEPLAKLIQAYETHGVVLPSEIRTRLLDGKHPIRRLENSAEFIDNLLKYSSDDLFHLFASDQFKPFNPVYLAFGHFDPQAFRDRVGWDLTDPFAAARKSLDKYPLTRRELAKIYDTFYRSVRGWSLTDEYNAIGIKNLDDKPSTDELVILRRILTEEHGGTSYVFRLKDLPPEIKKDPKKAFLATQIRESQKRVELIESIMALRDRESSDLAVRNALFLLSDASPDAAPERIEKMVRLFRRGFTEENIAKELAVSPDVARRLNSIANYVYNVTAPHAFNNRSRINIAFSQSAKEWIKSATGREEPALEGHMDLLIHALKLKQWTELSHSGFYREMATNRLEELQRKAEYNRKALMAATDRDTSELAEAVLAAQNKEELQLKKFLQKQPKLNDPLAPPKPTHTIYFAVGKKTYPGTTYAWGKKGDWISRTVYVTGDKDIPELNSSHGVDDYLNAVAHAPSDQRRALLDDVPQFKATERVYKYSVIDPGFFDKENWADKITLEDAKKAGYRHIFDYPTINISSVLYIKAISQLRADLLTALLQIHADKPNPYSHLIEGNAEKKNALELALAAIIRKIDGELAYDKHGHLKSGVIAAGLRQDLEGPLEHYLRALLNLSANTARIGYLFDRMKPLPATTLERIASLSDINLELFKSYAGSTGNFTRELESAFAPVVSRWLENSYYLERAKLTPNEVFNHLIGAAQKTRIDKIKNRSARNLALDKEFNRNPTEDIDAVIKSLEEIKEDYGHFVSLPTPRREEIRSFLQQQLRNFAKSEKKEDRALAEKLVYTLNALDDRGHMTQAKDDLEFEMAYEAATGGNERYDLTNYLERIKREKEALEMAGCTTMGPKPKGCIALDHYIEFMNDPKRGGGRGLSPEARIALVDPKLTPEHFDRLTRLENIIYHLPDGEKTTAQRRAFQTLIINPTPELIERTSALWDPLFHEYLASKVATKSASDDIVHTLIEASAKGKVKVLRAGKSASTTCSETDGDPILDIDFGESNKDLTDKLEKLAKWDALSRAMYALKEVHRDSSAPSTEIEDLMTKNLKDSRARVALVVRREAAQRILDTSLKTHTGSSDLTSLSLHDPKSQLGCQLRALLNPTLSDELRATLRAEAVSHAKKDTKEDSPEFEKKVNEYLNKLALTDSFHNQVEGRFRGRVAGQNARREVKPGAMGKEALMKSWLQENLKACIEHFEKQPKDKGLTSLDFSPSKDLQLIRKTYGEEIQAIRQFSSDQQRLLLEAQLEASKLFNEVGFVAGLVKGQNEQLNSQDVKDAPDKVKKKLRDSIDKNTAKLKDLRRRSFIAKSKLTYLSAGADGQTVEEDELDKWAFKHFAQGIEKESEKLRNGASVAPYPAASAIDRLEKDNELFRRVRDVIVQKLIRQVAEAKQANPPELHHDSEPNISELATEFTAFRIRTYRRQVEVDTRATRGRALKARLDAEGPKEVIEAENALNGKYRVSADDCIHFLETKKKKAFPFPKERISAEQADAIKKQVYEEGDDLSVVGDDYLKIVGDALLDYTRSKEQAKEFFRAIQPPPGTDATMMASGNGDAFTRAVNFPAHAIYYENLLRQFTSDPNRSFRISHDEAVELFKRYYADAVTERTAEDKELRALLAPIADLGFQWNGIELTFGKGSLWKMAAPLELRKQLEKFAKFGRYKQMGTDPWKEFVGMLGIEYRKSLYSKMFEFQDTAIEIKSGSNGKDFLNDPENAHLYLTFHQVGKKQSEANVLSGRLRKELEEFARLRKDVSGKSNKIWQGWGNKLKKDDAWYERVGDDLKKAYDDLEASLARINSLREELSEYGTIATHWTETGSGSSHTAGARDIATLIENRVAHMYNPDFEHAHADSLNSVIEGRKFLAEMIIVELVTLPLDFLTAGATRGAKALIWAARIAHGVQLAYRASLATKMIMDNVANTYFKKDYYQALPWEGIRESAHKQAIIFGTLPVLQAGAAAAGISEIIAGPASIFALTTGVELAFGSTWDQAWKHGLKAAPFGIPFNRVLGNAAASIPGIRYSSTAQGAFAFFGSYFIFAGMGAGLSLFDYWQKGKYIDPFGNEIKDPSLARIIGDSMLMGAPLDLLFAKHAVKEVQAHAARTHLFYGEGITVEKLAHQYAGPNASKEKFDAAVKTVRSGLDVAHAGEIQRLREKEKTANPTEKQKINYLLELYAEHLGFKGGKPALDRIEFERYFDKVYRRGTKYSTMGEMGVDMRALARADVMVDYHKGRTSDGKTFGVKELLEHSLFFRENHFDPEAFHEIPVKDLAAYLNKDIPAHEKAKLFQLLTEVGHFYGVSEPRLADFAIFAKEFQHKPDSSLRDVADAFNRIPKMRLAEVGEVVAKSKGDSSDPDVIRANQVVEAMARETGLSKQTFVETYEAIEKRNSSEAPIFPMLRRFTWMLGDTAPQRVRFESARGDFRLVTANRLTQKILHTKDRKVQIETINEMVGNRFFWEGTGRSQIPIEKMDLSGTSKKHENYVVEMGKELGVDGEAFLKYLKDPVNERHLLDRYGTITIDQAVHEFKTSKSKRSQLEPRQLPTRFFVTLRLAA